MPETEQTNGRRNGQGSIADLTRRVSQDASSLVRAEIELAKTEITQRLGTAALGGGMLAGAALFGVAAFSTLVAAAVLGLATAMDAWLAALIVTAALIVIAAVIALIGINRLRAASPPVPPETVQRVKEDVQWVKEHATSDEK
jgi:hypothetical protein